MYSRSRLPAIMLGGRAPKARDPLELREFFLVLSSFGNAFRRCEMAWVNGDHFGAKFVEQARPPSKAKAARQTEAIEN